MGLAPWFVEWLTRYIGLIFVGLFVFQSLLQVQNKLSVRNKLKNVGKAFGLMLLLWTPFLFSSQPYIKDSFADSHDPKLISWYHHTSSYQKYNLAVLLDTLGLAQVAFIAYELAAEQGLIPAKFRLCEMIEIGRGVDANHEQAFVCYYALNLLQPVYSDDEGLLHDAGNKASELSY
jgi:hypothetical protein